MRQSPKSFTDFILTTERLGFTSFRELTREELREIKRLASSGCANYDQEYGCLVLGGKCYMLYGAAYTNSALCKYFRKAVLPLNEGLEAIFSGIFSHGAARGCSICGKVFSPSGRGRFCSELCRAESKRIQDRESKRRQRLEKGQMSENRR